MFSILAEAFCPEGYHLISYFHYSYQPLYLYDLFCIQIFPIGFI